MHSLHRRHHLLWLSAAILASWIWTFVAGKDLNWDFINYHYYGAYALLEGRLTQDYFAASVQSYINPTAYLPLYWMIKAGWHSILIAGLLASFHALNVYLAIRLFMLLVPKTKINEWPLLLLVASLAFISPLHLTTIGSSFLDPVTSVMLLSSVYCLLKASQQPLEKIPFLAGCTGLWGGMAVGVKLTNGLYLPVIGFLFLCVVVQKKNWRLGIKALGLFLLAGFIGVALFHGYWSWLLWDVFNNPVFPLFNAVFQSPDFGLFNLQDKRFIGSGIEGLLSLPWEMTKHKAFIYSENTVPDVRVVVLCAVITVGLLGLGIKFLKSQPPTDSAATHHTALLLLTAFFILSFFLWGMTARIGRYAHPLWILVAPLLLAWLLNLFSLSWVRVIGAVILVGQIAIQAATGTPRWAPTSWTPTWFEVVVPQKLKANPHTLLTLGIQSYAVFTPFLHADSITVNLVGQYTQPAGKKMTAKLAALVQDSKKPVMVAFKDKSSQLIFDGQLSAKTRSDIDAVLSVYKLQTTQTECDALMLPFELISGFLWEGSPTDAKKSLQGERLFVCPVEPLNAASYAQVADNLARVDRVFDRIEDACGKQLEPRRMQTVRGMNGWIRTYFNSQNTLASNVDTVHASQFRSSTDIGLGKFKDWELNKNVPECKLFPPAFRWEH